MKTNLSFQRSRNAELAESGVLDTNSAWNNYAKVHHTPLINNGQKPYLVTNNSAANDEKITFRTNKVSEGTEKAKVENYAQLRHEHNFKLMQRIIELRKTHTSAVDDVLSAGHVENVGIEQIVVGIECVSGFRDAEVALHPDRVNLDVPEFAMQYLLMPIFFTGFKIPWRFETLNYLNHIGISESIKNISKRENKYLFYGSSKVTASFGGQKIESYGYITDPGTKKVVNLIDWSEEANLGEIENNLIDIFKEYKKEQHIENNSVVIYIPPDWEAVLEKRPLREAGDKEKLRKIIMDMVWVKDIKVNDEVPEKNIVMVEMSDRSVGVALALDTTIVPSTKVKAMSDQEVTAASCRAVLIKRDYDGVTGIRLCSVAGHAPTAEFLMKKRAAA